ncbi:hypothetical protein [Dysgonomonas termitidis]|uniref:DUF306 domain-containing protein n=1 Tax=Dysgonomonas termitidis TaxID=1516126 RepID=A0ABV9L2T8_9BACT
MKTKIIFLSIIIISLFSCSGDESGKETKYELYDVWQLVGFGNKNSYKELTTEICKDCFTIGFNESEIFGKSGNNNYWGNFTTKYPYASITLAGSNYMDEKAIDGHYFLQCISDINKFAYENGYLKLYYGNEGEYMLLYHKMAIN